MNDHMHRSNSVTSFSSHRSNSSVQIARSDSITDLFTLQKHLTNRKSQTVKTMHRNKTHLMGSRSMSSLPTINTAANYSGRTTGMTFNDPFNEGIQFNTHSFTSSKKSLISPVKQSFSVSAGSGNESPVRPMRRDYSFSDLRGSSDLYLPGVTSMHGKVGGSTTSINYTSRNRKQYAKQMPKYSTNGQNTLQKMSLHESQALPLQVIPPPQVLQQPQQQQKSYVAQQQSHADQQQLMAHAVVKQKAQKMNAKKAYVNTQNRPAVKGIPNTPLVYTGDPVSLWKNGMTKRQQLKLQMRNSFEFPNGEKFSPKKLQDTEFHGSVLPQGQDTPHVTMSPEGLVESEKSDSNETITCETGVWEQSTVETPPVSTPIAKNVAKELKKKSLISRIFRKIIPRFSSSSKQKPQSKLSETININNKTVEKPTFVMKPAVQEPIVPLTLETTEHEEPKTSKPTLQLEVPVTSPLIDMDVDMLFDSLIIASSPTMDTGVVSSQGLDSHLDMRPPTLLGNTAHQPASRTSSITSKSNIARLRLMQMNNNSNQSLPLSVKTASSETTDGANGNEYDSPGSDSGDESVVTPVDSFFQRLGNNFKAIRALEGDGSCVVYNPQGIVLKQDSFVALPTTKSSIGSAKDALFANMPLKGCLSHSPVHNASNASGSTPLSQSASPSTSSSTRSNSLSLKSSSQGTAATSRCTGITHSLKFNETVEVYPVYTSSEYERNLDPESKRLMQQRLIANMVTIKQELNNYKKFQMLVHYESIENTHILT